MKGVEHMRPFHPPMKRSLCMDSTRDVSISSNLHILEALLPLLQRYSCCLQRVPVRQCMMVSISPWRPLVHISMHIGRIGRDSDGELNDLTPFASPITGTGSSPLQRGARSSGLPLFGRVTKAAQNRSEERQETLLRRQQGST